MLRVVKDGGNRNATCTPAKSYNRKNAVFTSESNVYRVSMLMFIYALWRSI